MKLAIATTLGFALFVIAAPNPDPNGKQPKPTKPAKTVTKTVTTTPTPSPTNSNMCSNNQQVACCDSKGNCSAAGKDGSMSIACVSFV